MKYLIMCTFIFAFGGLVLTIYLCFILLKKKSQNWEKNKKLGQAEITMWVAEEGSYYYPCGKIIGITNQTAWSIHDSSVRDICRINIKKNILLALLLM